MDQEVKDMLKVTMSTHPDRETKSHFSRRHFLYSMMATGLAASAGTFPVRVHGQAPPKLRAAVIGHTGRGDYGHGLEGIFASRSNIEVVALADPDRKGRETTAARIGAQQQYADYRELLEKERPQLVSIAMRHADQHHAIALATLQSGSHIYCEKPFTRTPSEADDLLKEAGKRQLKIAVAHTMRMMPTVVRLRQAVTDGIIGDLVEMRAYGKQDHRAGGEDMMVLGSHLFDLMRMFAGDPESCSARVLTQGREIRPADGRLVKDNVGLVAGDQIFAQFSFPKGVNATFTSDARLRETYGHWGIELFGSKGAARINCDITPNVFIRHSMAWKPEGRNDDWKPLDPALLSSPPPHNDGPVGNWLKSIADDGEPECSGRNAAWAVEMVISVYRAALGGRRVTFPLAERQHPLTQVTS